MFQTYVLPIHFLKEIWMCSTNCLPYLALPQDEISNNFHFLWRESSFSVTQEFLQLLRFNDSVYVVISSKPSSKGSLYSSGHLDPLSQ